MTELLGHCMGVVGISLDDFCRLRFDEIDAILSSWAQTRTGAMRDRWEMMRLHIYMTLSPFCKDLPNPKDLLPLPWEEEPEEEEPEIALTDEEREAIFEEQKRKLGWE